MNPNHNGSTSGEEPEALDPTPVTAALIGPAFLDTLMECMARQDAAQKAATEHITALAVILVPRDGPTSAAMTMIRDSCSTPTEQPTSRTRLPTLST